MSKHPEFRNKSCPTNPNLAELVNHPHKLEFAPQSQPSPQTRIRRANHTSPQTRICEANHEHHHKPEFVEQLKPPICKVTRFMHLSESALRATSSPLPIYHTFPISLPFLDLFSKKGAILLRISPLALYPYHTALCYIAIRYVASCYITILLFFISE